MHRARSLFVTVAALLCLAWSLQGQTPAPPNQLLVYLGTYTGAKSKGIYMTRLDLGSGALSAPTLAAETPSPSFLAMHPTRDFLYAVNEVSNYDGKNGSVSAFAVDRASGALKPLNQQSSAGGGPAHLVVDHAGKNVLVANYGGGNIAVLPIEQDGRLKPHSAFVQHTGASVNPDRQKEPHAHSIYTDANDRFAYVADLGIDKVMIYKFDSAKGSLTPNQPPSASVQRGAGPRHIAFSPNGRFAYVINEIHCTLTAFTRDPESGALTELNTVSTLPAGQAVASGYSTAEVLMHPSGKFLYGSNRGHDSIALFAVDEKTGRLTFVETQPTQGNTPRGFEIDPSGAYLLVGNQRSDSVVVFRVNAQTGKLTPTGNKIEVGAPVSMAFAKPR
jgi:6-phosphogluconolactonase